MSKSLYNMANIITKFQIVLLREKFFEFILIISKETHFTIYLNIQLTHLIYKLYAC